MYRSESYRIAFCNCLENKGPSLGELYSLPALEILFLVFKVVGISRRDYNPRAFLSKG